MTTPNITNIRQLNRPRTRHGTETGAMHSKPKTAIVERVRLEITKESTLSILTLAERIQKIKNNQYAGKCIEYDKPQANFSISVMRKPIKGNINNILLLIIFPQVKNHTTHTRQRANETVKETLTFFSHLSTLGIDCSN